MFAWVLIIWLGGPYGGPTAINDIASQGDCEWLASQVAAKIDGKPNGYTCTRYRKAK